MEVSMQQLMIPNYLLRKIETLDTVEALAVLIKAAKLTQGQVFDLIGLTIGGEEWEQDQLED